MSVHDLFESEPEDEGSADFPDLEESDNDGVTSDPPPVRFHMLRAAGRSPAHAQLAIAGDSKKPTQSMEKGTAVHALVFGTRRVIPYTPPPDPKAKPGSSPKRVVRNGKTWDAFKAANPDTEILAPADYDKAQRMAEAVRACPLALDVLRGTQERTLLWTSQGRTCRTTPDAASYMEFASELKTCSCSDPQRFAWHALRMHYHAQMAWHLEGIAGAGLGQPRTAYVVAVESAAPYPVTVLQLTERALEAGEKLCRLWFERLIGCEKTGEWPPYAQSVVPLDVADEDFDLSELTFAEVA
jgi:hypothetical protein